ncbi:MAG TPA: hypothetical protein DEQ02_05525 [Ruminococcaceae bacterium]|nr:hypothetical protein [Oscillospiraceae bacterium]
MKKRIFVSVFLIMALLFAGCIQRKEVKDMTMDINVMLTRSEEWGKISYSITPPEEDFFARVDGSTATIPITAELLRQFYGYSDKQVQSSPFINHSTTHQAYVNLIGGNVDDTATRVKTDIIFATPPSPEELSMANEKGIELDRTPIARDGFVFITHKDNPVNSLTVEQIQKIYTGEILSWESVGGEDRRIKAYQRDANSGSQTMMEDLVMEGKKMMRPRDLGTSMSGVILGISEYTNGPDSIGYTFSYYLNNLYKSPNIKVLKVDGVEYNDETLNNGSYPFSSAYYAVIREDEPEDSQARILRDFLVSGEGQQIIKMAGYYPVSGK